MDNETSNSSEVGAYGRSGDSAGHVLLTHVSQFDESEGVIFEAELDPEHEPFLNDHRMNGIALLPGVMGIEGFCSAAIYAARILGHEENDLCVKSVEDIQFRVPLKFYRDKARLVSWVVKMREVDAVTLSAQVELQAEMVRFGRLPETVVHFSGTVYLERAAKQATETENIPEPMGELTVSSSVWLAASKIYQLYFHGPAFQVLEAVEKVDHGMTGKLYPHLPPLSTKAPLFTSNPVLIELCLQTAGIWEIGKTGRLALPRSIGSLRLYARDLSSAEVYAQVTPREDVDGQMHFDARVIDSEGRVYLELDDYSTQPLPYEVENEGLAAIQNWFAVAL